MQELLHLGFVHLYKDFLYIDLRLVLVHRHMNFAVLLLHKQKHLHPEFDHLHKGFLYIDLHRILVHLHKDSRYIDFRLEFVHQDMYFLLHLQNLINHHLNYFNYQLLLFQVLLLLYCHFHCFRYHYFQCRYQLVL